MIVFLKAIIFVDENLAAKIAKIMTLESLYDWYSCNMTVVAPARSYLAKNTHYWSGYHGNETKKSKYIV